MKTIKTCKDCTWGYWMEGWWNLMDLGTFSHCMRPSHPLENLSNQCWPSPWIIQSNVFAQHTSCLQASTCRRLAFLNSGQSPKELGWLRWDRYGPSHAAFASCNWQELKMIHQSPCEREIARPLYRLLKRKQDFIFSNFIGDTEKLSLSKMDWWSTHLIQVDS